MRRPSFRLLPRAVGVGACATLLAGVVAIAVQPTGAPTPAGLIPASSRLAVDRVIGSDHVLLVSTADDRLGVLVAYRSDKGWLAVDAAPVTASAVAAWTSTQGAGPVPALSMTYGRATSRPGVAAVDVAWADGSTTRVAVSDDGSWLAVHPGNVEVAQVRLLAAGNRVVQAVPAP